MKISPGMEISLRRALNSELIEDEIEKLKLENLEIKKDLNNSMVSQYSELVTACTSLRDLKSRISDISRQNEILKHTIFNQDKENIKTQVGSLEICSDRLTLLHTEVTAIREFISKCSQCFDLLNGDIKNTDNLYKFCCNVDFINKRIGTFKRFSFYSRFLNIHKSLNEEILKLCYSQVDPFLISHMDLPNKGDLLFSSKIECNVLLDVFYLINISGLEDNLISHIDSTRANIIRSLNSSDGDYMDALTSNILISYVLQKHLSINPFYSEIVSVLNSNPIEDILAIAKIRNVFSFLRISNMAFDTLFENCVYSYFNKNFQDEDFPGNFINFLEERFAFLDSLNEKEAELFEILIKKIDDSLILFVSTSSMDDFVETRNKVNEVIQVLLSKVENPFLKIEEELVSKKNNLIEIKIKEFEHFLVKKSTKEAVEKIIEYKKMEDSGFRRDFGEILFTKIEGIAKERSKDEIALLKDTIKRNLIKEN